MYREIKIFRATMLTGSTSRAAEKLQISQPAVSQAIKQLEEKSGIKLFERSRGRLIPTQEAMALMSEVDRHFVGMEEIAHKLRSLSDSGTGKLAVAAHPAIGNAFVPRAIASFDAAKRDIKISHMTVSSREVYQQVMSGQVDFGIMADEIDPVGLEFSTFMKAEGVIVMNKNHTLAKEAIIYPEQLAKNEYLSLSSHDTSQRQLNKILAESGITLKVRVETPYSHTICEMARLGLGIGIVHPVAAYDFLNSDLIIRPFSKAIIFHGLMIFRPGKPMSCNSKDFIRALRIQLEKDINLVMSYTCKKN